MDLPYFMQLFCFSLQSKKEIKNPPAKPDNIPAMQSEEAIENTRTAAAVRKNVSTVQALASQGGGIVLGDALVSTSPVDHLTVSPLLRGNNPYP